MDYVLFVGLLGFAGILIGCIGYKRITENIIKTQERELNALRRENKRLKSALRSKRGGATISFKEAPYPVKDNQKIKPSDLTFEDF